VTERIGRAVNRAHPASSHLERYFKPQMAFESSTRRAGCTGWERVGTVHDNIVHLSMPYHSHRCCRDVSVPGVVGVGERPQTLWRPNPRGIGKTRPNMHRVRIVWHTALGSQWQEPPPHREMREVPRVPGRLALLRHTCVSGHALVGEVGERGAPLRRVDRFRTEFRKNRCLQQDGPCPPRARCLIAPLTTCLMERGVGTHSPSLTQSANTDLDHAHNLVSPSIIPVVTCSHLKSSCASRRAPPRRCRRRCPPRSRPHSAHSRTAPATRTTCPGDSAPASASPRARRPAGTPLRDNSTQSVRRHRKSANRTNRATENALERGTPPTLS
jgi:hypothetical protein